MNKALWLIGGLGLGTGLMYMLDPERGRRRRALARWQVESYRRQANTLLDQTRHALGEQTHALGQQARGLLAQARTPLRGGYGLGEMWRGGGGQVGGTKRLLVVWLVGVGGGVVDMGGPQGGAKRRGLGTGKNKAYR